MLPFKNNCTFYAIKMRNVFEDIIKDLLAANDDPTFHKSMFLYANQIVANQVSTYLLDFI